MKNKFIKALAAGLAAGIIATGVKTIWEIGFPVRDDKTDSPPLVLADRVKQTIGGESLSEQEKPSVKMTIHWIFGISTCIFYSLLAEKYAAAKSGNGFLFGIALYSATHATVLPALDTEPWFFDNNPVYALNEFTGHLAFGFCAETARNFIREKLD